MAPVSSDDQLLGIAQLGHEKCFQEGEEIFENVKDLENRKPDYWSLIIAKRRKK